MKHHINTIQCDSIHFILCKREIHPPILILNDMYSRLALSHAPLTCKNRLLAHTTLTPNFSAKYMYVSSESQIMTTRKHEVTTVNLCS